MSYCRFSAGDVYLYYNMDGFYECCVCKLYVPTAKHYVYVWDGHDIISVDCSKCTTEDLFCDNCLSWRESQSFPDPISALEHLMLHKAFGHKVPNRAIKRLKAEIKLLQM